MPEALNSSPKFPGANSPRKRQHASSASGADNLQAPRPNGLRSESVGGYGAGPSNNAVGINAVLGGGGGRDNGGEGSSTSTSMLTSGGTTPMIRSTTSGPILTPNTDHSSIGNSHLHDAPERRLEELNEKLQLETKLKEGAENLLQVLDHKKVKEAKDAKAKAQKELTIINYNIQQIQNEIHAIKRPRTHLGPARVVRQKSVRLAGVGLIGGNNDEVNDQGRRVEEELDSGAGLNLNDILAAMEEKNKPPEYYVGHANSLVVFFRRNPNYKYDISWKEFGKRVQFMLLHTSKEVVAAGYRMTRYAITDIKSLCRIRELSTDLITIRSLSRDSKSNVEREQALKFVRAFMDVKGGGVKQVSTGVLRAIISCAEQETDRLRGVFLETLSELLILDPERILQCGGVKVLTQVLRDGPYEFSEFVYPAFLYLLDMPATRQYVRAGCDLEGVLAAFTDARELSETKLRSSAKIVCGILKTWDGLMYLSMYNLRAIRCLVECLSIPSTNVREVILQLLFDIFRIKPPAWTNTFLAGRRLTTYGRVNLKSEAPPQSTTTRTAKQEANPGNLVDHYLALLLSVFFEAGMLEALMTTVQDVTEMKIVRKTTLLIGEVLKLASRLLPNGYSAKKQLLPALFNSAARLGDEERFAASAAVYQIDSLNRTLHRSALAASSAQRTSTEEPEARSGQAEQVRMNMAKNIDDTHFRSLILETNILNTKNHLKWNWNALTELIQGPLLNPKRLEEAIKATKFLKRLLSFYRPFKHRFADIIDTKPNQRYVQVGCALFRTLLQSQEGVKYLAENKLLRQIAECLAQLDKMSGITSHEPVFSRARLSDTLSSGYFTMLGALSSDPKGLSMMSKWCMFSMFYHLSDLNDREDLIQMFLGAMDFTLEGHPRILFTKVLTSGARGTRLFCTNHLRIYINPNAIPPNFMHKLTNPAWAVNTETAQWATRALIQQLYDPDVEVCETAVKILEEACNTESLLEYVVKCQPQLDHLGEIGAPLLLKFLSTSIGYHYLNELDYIEREMDDWFHGRNDSYVLTVEASFARAFADDEPVSRQGESPTYDPEMMGLVPPHFYRELARTREGCRLLQEKGHFEEFSWFIEEHGLESSDPEIVTKLKGCLWAVGNIGCMPFGAPFLDNANTAEMIIKIAQESEVWTVKGTAFFVLGLISRTMTGYEALAQNGWDVTTGAMGESSGFCVPIKLEKVLCLRKGAWKMGLRFPEQIHVEGDDANEIKILTKVGELNGMENIESGYLKELNRMKTVLPTYFTSPSLYLKVMQVLENYRFRPNIRRHIIDLFDRSTLETIAKERYNPESMDSDPVRSPGVDSISTMHTDTTDDGPTPTPEPAAPSTSRAFDNGETFSFQPRSVPIYPLSEVLSTGTSSPHH